MVNNNSDFSEDIVTPWRWSKTETRRSFLDDFIEILTCDVEVVHVLVLTIEYVY